MEMKKKKEISIYKLFLKYLIGFMAVLVCCLIVVVFGVSYAFQSGLLQPAKETDEKLNALEETFEQSFEKEMLPSYCSYVVIDSIGNFIDSNMSEKNIEKMKSYFSNGTKAYYTFYKQITQTNGDIIIIKYDMLTHFTNPALNRIIPYPEYTLIFLLLLMFILTAIVTAIRFSKKLKRNLVPIVKTTEKIQAQDLDFEIVPTEITEFNATLSSIDQLKTALTVSLNKQWSDEQTRKKQLSALAHDIKTPLTIIKGNAELLLETEPAGEDAELISYIRTSSDIIEKYLELLMEVVNQDVLLFQKHNSPLQGFLNEINIEAIALCKTKNMMFRMQKDAKSDALSIDATLLKRAVMNIIDNAVRYSMQDSCIDMIIAENKKDILFEIDDSGPGFTAEGLQKATQEFYTEDTARTNHNYGLGLNFVKMIVEMHNGTMKIENRTQKGGGRVSLWIPKNMT